MNKGQSLLKLQIGPVQEFIAQARSTRDLWSGSYLLSWLVASGLSCLLQGCAEAGFDEDALMSCVIFPQLKSQPLMQKFQSGLFPPPAETEYRNDEMLTPNLTNLFLAQLPSEVGKTTELARAVEQAIRDEWKAIADKCWEFGGSLLKDADKNRFDRQVVGMLHVAWQVTPLVCEGDANQVLKRLPTSKEARDKLNTVAGADLCFPATLALNAWQLDAVRQVREFPGARDANNEPGKRNEKDSLTGREEQICGGHDWWTKRVAGKQFTVQAKNSPRPPAQWEMLFRERQASEYFGAITFIKRVWHLVVLEQEHGLEAGHRAASRGKQFPFPSTLHIASHDPAKNEDDPHETQPDEAPDELKYFAVLTMDGDEMGKWMSGEKFSKPVNSDDLNTFSDGLSTFGLKCARRIVEACDGRLIYSGGDDVVALLPADTALQCAEFLRAAFRGSSSFIPGLTALASRLLKTHERKKAQAKAAGQPYEISIHLQDAAADKLFMAGSREAELTLHPGADSQALSLPGISADVSAGIAIAHFKSPLQDVVREAQTAEHRAKHQLGRGAVAVTLMKRSGEITEWGCRWDSGGLKIYAAVMEVMLDGAVSGKFPHRVIELLNGYLTETSPLAASSLEPVKDFPVMDIALREFRYALGRQAKDNKSPAYTKLEAIAADRAENGQPPLLRSYLTGVHKQATNALEEAQGNADKWVRLTPEAQRRLEHAPVESPVQALIGLCQTVAFTHRTGPDDECEPFVPSVPSTPLAER